MSKQPSWFPSKGNTHISNPTIISRQHYKVMYLDNINLIYIQIIYHCPVKALRNHLIALCEKNMHHLIAHTCVNVATTLEYSPQYLISLNNYMYDTLIKVTLLSANIAHPTRCNKNICVANSQCVGGTSLCTHLSAN